MIILQFYFFINLIFPVNVSGAREHHRSGRAEREHLFGVLWDLILRGRLRRQKTEVPYTSLFWRKIVPYLTFRSFWGLLYIYIYTCIYIYIYIHIYIYILQLGLVGRNVDGSLILSPWCQPWRWCKSPWLTNQCPNPAGSTAAPVFQWHKQRYPPAAGNTEPIPRLRWDLAFIEDPCIFISNRQWFVIPSASSFVRDAEIATANCLSDSLPHTSSCKSENNNAHWKKGRLGFSSFLKLLLIPRFGTIWQSAKPLHPGSGIRPRSENLRFIVQTVSASLFWGHWHPYIW